LLIVTRVVNTIPDIIFGIGRKLQQKTTCTFYEVIQCNARAVPALCKYDI